MTIASYYAPEAEPSSVTARAYESLSGLSRSLLWYMDIERLELPEVCSLIGFPQTDVISMTARARFELRYAWLEQQDKSPRIPKMCKETTRELARVRSRRLRLPHTDDVERHLTVCMRCAILEEEIDNLQEHLKVALLPMSYGPHGSRTRPQSERWI